MNKTIKKTISCFLILAFLFNIVLPLREARAMTAPWWSGSQAYGSVNVASAAGGENNPNYNTKNQQPAGEPVLVHNGDFVYEHLDFLIPSRGMNTEIKRIYKSQSRYNNRLGYGWDMFYNKRIVPLCNGDLHYLNGKLNRFTFKYIDGINYISPQGIYDTLVQNPDGTFTLTEPHKITYAFDQNGVLTQIQDRNANTINFTYDPAGKLPIIGKSIFSNDPNPKVIAYDYQLTKITDTVGREIILNYDVNGKLATITDFSGRVYSYSYDPSGNGDLISFTTPATPDYPNGLTTIYTYDAQDRNLKTITDAKNQTYLVNYYDTSDRVYLQDYGQGQFSFAYNTTYYNQTTYNLTTVTDPKGFVTDWIVDPYGSPVSKTEYTAGLRPTDPPYYNTTYSYNNNLERTNTTYAEGNGVKYTYDESNPNQLSRGNLLEIRRKPDMTQPDYNQTDIFTTFTYEPNFNFIKTSTDPEGNVTTFNYDAKGNLLSIVYPQVGGQTPSTTFTYNPYGQLETVTDPNGNTTKYEYYSATGYLWKIIQDPGPPPKLNYVTEFTYDSVGNPLTIKNARGYTTSFQFNALNQLTNSTSSAPFNYENKYSYDENGNLKKLERETQDPQNPWQTTEYTYTALDQLQTIKQYLSSVLWLLTSFTYDLNGNRSSITDAENNLTTYQYDERNLIWKTIDSLNNTAEYSYDYNSNLSSIKDAKLNEKKYDYDDFDRLQKTTYADNSFKQFGYDKNSNLTNLTNPANQTITYTYDALNRLDLKTYPDATTVDYGYDLGSRLSSVLCLLSSVGYTYDAVNRITQTNNQLQTTNYQILYQYDAVGNRTQLTYPNGLILDYTYDELNRLSAIYNLQSPICNYSYDALSRRTKTKLSNSTVAKYTYDSLNRLTKLTNTAYNLKDLSLDSGQGAPPQQRLPYSLARPISQFDYSYDDVGNRLSVAKSTLSGVEGSTYQYDNIYQLTDVTYSPGSPSTVNYDFDNVGNREVVTEDGIPTTYTSNNLNQYTDVGGAAYQSDPNGNLISDGINTYNYDYENRLSSVVSLLTSATYEYDGLGRRIKKDVDGTVTYFVYDGDQVIEERNASGILVASYVYGSGIDEVLRMTRNGADYYYHYDGLGSVSDITNSTNSTIESYSYDVYGQPTIKNSSGQTIPTSSIGNRFMFTGREWEAETGLYHYRARAYSPKIGRFLQRDPYTWSSDDPWVITSFSFNRELANNLIATFDLKQQYNNFLTSDRIGNLIIHTGQSNPDLLHLYLYCSNNPVSWVDPVGLDKQKDTKGNWYFDIGYSGFVLSPSHPGINVGVQIGNQGINVYYGVGLGIGAGLTATFHPAQTLPSPGTKVTVTGRIGIEGFGIKATGSVTQGGPSGRVGFGIGIGVGISSTATNTVRILEWKEE